MYVQVRKYIHAGFLAAKQETSRKMKLLRFFKRYRFSRSKKCIVQSKGIEQKKSFVSRYLRNF